MSGKPAHSLANDSVFAAVQLIAFVAIAASPGSQRAGCHRRMGARGRGRLCVRLLALPPASRLRGWAGPAHLTLAPEPLVGRQRPRLVGHQPGLPVAGRPAPRPDQPGWAQGGTDAGHRTSLRDPASRRQHRTSRGDVRPCPRGSRRAATGQSTHVTPRLPGHRPARGRHDRVRRPACSPSSTETPSAGLHTTASLLAVAYTVGALGLGPIMALKATGGPERSLPIRSRDSRCRWLPRWCSSTPSASTAWPQQRSSASPSRWPSCGALLVPSPRRGMHAVR